MTAQVADQVLFNKLLWEFIGITGGRLFDPEDWKIKPASTCTACWRGFVCQYAIEENKLVLDSLIVHDTEDGHLPAINGVEPSFHQDILFDFEPESPPAAFSSCGAKNGGPALYRNLHLRLPFSGGVLLARDFIPEMYVHMGFQKPHRFRSVIELCAEDGAIVTQLDHSAQMEKIRQQCGTRTEEEVEMHDSVPDWIEYAFSMEYSVG